VQSKNDTSSGTSGEQTAIDSATVEEARAIQLQAGTPSAVEFLKARDIEGSVIEQVLIDDLPDAPPSAD